MEPLEFLGGKYQQANLILPGSLQTFRAVDAGAGRDVFVHRVPASDPAAQQLALLLSSALVRSAKARRMVLDVVEEDGFAHVVTETEHQCLLLREWLQFEINQVSGGEASARPPAAPPHASEPAAPAASPQVIMPKPNSAPAVAEPVPEPRAEAKQEPGEFTRMFMAGMGSPPSPSAPAAPRTAAPAEAPPPVAKVLPPLEETQPVLSAFDEAAQPEPSKPELPKPVPAEPERVKPEPAKAAPGEFTRMFMAGTGAAQQEARPAAVQQDVRPTAPPQQEMPPAAPQQQESRPAAPAKPMPEAGEFTRFFRTSNPPERKSSPDAGRSVERPSNPDFGRTGFVQRPSTPLPVPPPPATPAAKATQPGEFTRMFMQGGGPMSAPPTPSFPQSAPSSAPDPFATPGGGGMFAQPASAVPPTPAKPMGEYTRIFGSSEQAPPVQQPSSVAAPPPAVSDDPLLRTAGPLPPAPATPPPARGPSEYTLVMSGRPSEAAPTNAPTPAAAAPGGGAHGIPLPQMQMKMTPPPNPMQGLHVPPPPSAHAATGAGGASASASSPLGSMSAQVAGPKMPPPMNFKAPAIKPPAAPAVAAPQTGNKLVLLFIVLGVLAILLIVLIILLLKK